MSQLRVLRVIARMNVGGPAVQVAGLMRYLPRDRFEQRLITGWCADDEADYLESQAPGVEATRLGGLGRAIRPGDDARALAQLRRAIRDFRPHIVHTHTAKAGTLGRVATTLAGTGSAKVHTFHGHLLHGYFSPAKTRAVIEVERTLARGTDRLVAVGPHVRDDLLAAGIGRVDQYAVIPPGLDLPAARSRANIRSEWNLPPDAPVIAFIGRLTSIKRPDRFVEVVHEVYATHPHVRFLVAGAGDQHGIVAQAAQTLPITMLGWRDDIQDVLAASDAVVLTSDNEGTPLSLIQAALMGLPVIATSVGSVPDVVIDGETGWLASTDAIALAAATREFLADPQEAARRGRLAQVRAVSLYGVERLAADHAALYELIVAERTQG